jgi:DNA polymerase-3 subunit alpha
LDDGREAVRFGLRAIRNVGDNAARAIVDARSRMPGGRFVDLASFCREVDWNIVSKRVVECLAKCGALDQLGSRSQVIGSLETAIASGQQHQKASARGQIGLFDLGGPVSIAPPVVQLTGWPELARKSLLTWEKELLGLYLSDHPLTEVTSRALQLGRRQIAELESRTTGEQVKVVGMIAGVRRIPTRNNRTMAVIDLEDLTGNIELVVFPDSYESNLSLLEEDSILDVTAKLDRRNEQIQLVFESASDDLSEFGEVEIESTRTVHLSIPATGDVWADIRVLQQLDAVLGLHEGDDRVVLHLPMGGSRVALKSRKHRVESGDELVRAVTELLGERSLRIEEPGVSRPAPVLIGAD